MDNVQIREDREWVSVVSGSPGEESQGDGVDLALQVRDSPESLSSRFWIFNMHQAFNSSTKDI